MHSVKPSTAKKAERQKDAGKSRVNPEIYREDGIVMIAIMIQTIVPSATMAMRFMTVTTTAPTKSAAT